MKRKHLLLAGAALAAAVLVGVAARYTVDCEPAAPQERFTGGGGFVPGNAGGGGGAVSVTGGNQANKAITDVQNGAATTAYFVNAAISGGGLIVTNNTVGVNWAGLNAQANDRLGWDGTATVAYNASYQMHHGIEWCEELAGNDANSSIVWDNASCQIANSGTCAIATTSAANRPGITLQSTAANAAGHARVTTNRAAYSFGSDTLTAEFIGAATNTLAGSSEDYDLFLGFGDSASTAVQTDGAGILYHLTTGGGAFSSGSANSTKFQIETSKASTRLWGIMDGSATDTVDVPVVVGNLAAAPATGTIYNFRVSCSTTRCDFDKQVLGTDGAYVHAASACSSGCTTAATSIPGAGDMVGVIAEINKWQGTTARIFNLDAVCVRGPFTGAAVR